MLICFCPSVFQLWVGSVLSDIAEQTWYLQQCKTTKPMMCADSIISSAYNLSSRKTDKTPLYLRHTGTFLCASRMIPYTDSFYLKSINENTGKVC